MRAGNAAEKPSDGVESDDDRELLDVPAAVVCAACGSPECTGCIPEVSDASGIVAIVPWERPGNWLRRLWHTSCLATLSSQNFFGALPAGEVGRAFTFAVLVELLAVTGLVVGLLPIALAIPGFAAYAAQPEVLSGWLRATAFGIPMLACTMVAIHAVHGVSLDIGARRYGSQQRARRGLRFGLYSCGWDLVTLPLGIAIVAIIEGLGHAWEAVPRGWAAPGYASRAYLSGFHGLSEAAARRATRFAVWMTASFIAILAATIATSGLALAALG